MKHFNHFDVFLLTVPTNSYAFIYLPTDLLTNVAFSSAHIFAL